MIELLGVKSILGIVAGIIAFGAYIIYIISIIRGESKPNRVTWWIWTFMGLVLALSYYYAGATTTIWSPIVEFIGPLLIGILSIWYGEGSLEDRTDVICIIGAVLSVLLWIISGNPVVALVTNLIIDAFALIPTIRKSYFRPDGENFWAWFGTMTADTVNLFAVNKFTFAILLYPLYMLFADVVIVGILVRKKKKIFQWIIPGK